MFATIGDLISYLLQLDVKLNLQTFGAVMALAFAGAYIVFTSEFKRKEADGTIRGIVITEETGQPASWLELLLNAVLGFLLGYKAPGILSSLYHGTDPAPGLLSLQGSLVWGMVLAAVWAIWIYTDRRKAILPEPEAVTRVQHPYQLMPYITFMVGIWGFLGAKLFDTAEHIQELRYVPWQVLLARSGFTYYGGLIFGILTFLYIGYRHKIKMIHMLDIGSPGMMLAYGIGRIGCHLSGDGDWGIVNGHVKPGWLPQWAWSFTYPHNAIDAGVYIPGCTSLHCHQLPMGVYPTPLYEAVGCLLLFTTMWIIRKSIKTPGALFYLFLLLNGAERYFIEMLRITPKYQLLGIQLSQAQLIALLFIAGGLAGFVWLSARYYFSYRNKTHVMKKWMLTGAGLLLFCGLQAQTPDLANLRFKVEEAPEWSALFIRNNGWFGGDGIYSIPLNGVEHQQSDSLLFIFSDSMIGTIENDSLLPGSRMVHNTVAILGKNAPDIGSMHFSWAVDAKGEAASVFEPHTPNTQPRDYYWLGDGFVNQELNNTLYIFGYRVRNVSDDAFGFREVGNTLIKIRAGAKPPFTGYEQMDTPLFFKNKAGDIGSFGAGIYVNTKQAKAPAPDGYVYVYGVHGLGKQMVVARVKPADFEHFDQWGFWDGHGWNKDMNQMAAVTDKVSNELSLSPLPDGRYALIFQEGGMGTTIGMRIGASPIGPFGPVIKLWDCSKDAEEKTYVMYNAKAHPGISKPGELLISYNVNSVEFLKDLHKHPHLYRPRFIRLKLDN
ncbi:DUF4185 domain-containing protein [Chitinophaga agrisoli]|uniref:DUF4185 domain-containing protein n=1 Tax=Chitinophaga agrisoli TaxID=2607653 RepID=A0A5B2VUG7_9BACT|nr:prolipoprotein diacylglyceryl transferase family protein [Chitinophaga agrisoli]KAA2242705.1 DUF4185 domain-containing protein [Chitinophaga agrisoli]